MAVGKGTIWRYGLAFVALVVIVTTWILMAEVVKNNVASVYLTAYIVHSFWAVSYPLWITWKVFPGNCKCNRAQDGKVSWKRALLASTFINFLGIVGALAWYLSLQQTNVAANSAVYMSMTAFTFLLSVPMLRERITVLKVTSVAIQIGGVFMVAYAKDTCTTPHWSSLDNATNGTLNSSAFASVSTDLGAKPPDPCNNNNGTVLGYVYLLISIFSYALYEVFYKRFVALPGDPAEVSNGFRIIGLSGIHCLLYYWPILLIVHYSGIQPFVWPSLGDLGLIFLTALCDMVMNSALLVCVALTSPLFAGVGQTLVLPASVVVDYFIRHYTLKWFAFIGIALIVAGFVGFDISYFWQQKMDSKDSHQRKESDSSNHKKGLAALEEDSSSVNSSSDGSTVINSSPDEISELLPRKTKKPLKFRAKYLKYII